MNSRISLDNQLNNYSLDSTNESEKNCSSDKMEISHLSYASGGFISANKNIFNNINLSESSKLILEESIKGTPFIKIGNACPKVMMIAGIHGNELSPQIAILSLIDEILNMDLNGTVYIVPFASPKSSMNNSRFFDSKDLNRTAHIEGSISNAILKKAEELKVSGIGDFHSTAPKSNPGKEGVFCTRDPSPESFYMARFIASVTGSEALNYPKAGIPFKGALEDEANLRGIPAITCEVLAPIGFASLATSKRSLVQMKSFLMYYGLIDSNLY